MSKQSTQLATTGEGYIALQTPSDKIKEIVEANIGNTGIRALDLDRIKVPAGGGLAWEVPSLTGPEMQQNISGIIIYWKEVRAFWSDPFSGAGDPPQCASEDAVHGAGDPGGGCAVCPWSQWSSDPSGGKGQACKLIRQVFMIRDSDLLPIVFPLPPTSIAPMHRYLLRLASKGIPHYNIVSEFAMEVAVSNGGIRYSRLVPTMLRQLEPAEQKQIRAYVDGIRPSLEATRIAQDDYPQDS